MCECKLILDNKLTDRQAYYVEKQKHDFVHYVNGKAIKLLEGFDIEGLINYAAITEVKNCFGVKSGYVIVIGEQ